MESKELIECSQVVENVVAYLNKQKKEVIDNGTTKNHTYNSVLDNYDFIAFCAWFLKGTTYSSQDFVDDNDNMSDIIKDSMIYYIEDNERCNTTFGMKYGDILYNNGTYLPFYETQKYLYNLFIKFER